jgi:hypothetical protein
MPRKPTVTPTGSLTLRVSMVPEARYAAGPSRPTPTSKRRIDWFDAAPYLLGAASAGLLLLATVGWPWASGLIGQGVAAYEYDQGLQCVAEGASESVSQSHFQAAVANNPRFAPARIDLGRSYLRAGLYRGAVRQADAALMCPHTRAEASMAYAVRGAAHYALGEKTRGEDDLTLAVRTDESNLFAKRALSRLAGTGGRSFPQEAAFFRAIERP